MSEPKKLYKSTITIWSEFDPRDAELIQLAHEATAGVAFCSSNEVELVTNPDKFPNTDFFRGSTDDQTLPSGWTKTDDNTAWLQGWCVFEAESGFEIQRVDDPQNWPYASTSTSSEPIFPSDESARAFVLRKATEGDPLAVKALALTQGGPR